MDFGAEVDHHGPNKKIVFAIVLLGIAVLSAGAFVAFRKRAGGPVTDSPGEDLSGFSAWCKLRSTWAKEVGAMEPDIMLKSIRPADAAERKVLERKRNALCQTYAAKVRDLKVTDERIQKVEVALVKEGKARANVSVMIHNALVALDNELVQNSIKAVREGLRALKKDIREKIDATRKATGAELAQVLAGVPDCKGIYRGPMTDQGTADDPYVSWKELELRLKAAETRYQDQLRVLEPMEQYANHIRHELIRRYRPHLRACWKKTLRANPAASPQVGILIRLKSSGKVKTMGLATMKVREEKILDCMLSRAPRWLLPPPAKDGDRVIVELDFSTI